MAGGNKLVPYFYVAGRKWLKRQSTGKINGRRHKCPIGGFAELTGVVRVINGNAGAGLEGGGA